jgi:hypothetical protein
MPRDRLRPLFEVIASGDPAKVRQEGTRLIEAIVDDIADLRKDKKMIDDLLVRYGGAEDQLTPAERSAKVREAALALASSGRDVITPGEVLEHLKGKNIEFAISRPASMVGTVLFQMDEFERLGVGQFKYSPKMPTIRDASSEAK